MFGLNKEDVTESNSAKKFATRAMLGLGVLTAGYTCTETMPETERGLDYRFGKMVTNETSELRQPGLTFKAPWTTVKHARIDLQHLDIDSQRTNTKDNQQIIMTNTVFYKLPIDKLITIFKNNPDYESKLEKGAISAVKSALGHTEAQNVASNRDAIMVDVTKETHDKIAKELSIDVDQVLMPNYEFDEPFQKAVSAASREKAVLTQKQTQLEQSAVDAKKTVVVAQSQADAKRISADAAAYTTLKTKNAEAEGFDRVQKVIGFQNMGTYLYTNKWNGVESTVKGAATPMIDMRGPK